MLFFIYESAWKGWFFTLFGLSSCDYDDSANMVGIPVVAPKGELGKTQVCGGFKLCHRSCHYNNNNYIGFIKSSGGNQYKMWLNNILKVIDWATFVWSLNPQVAGIKGELNYVFLLRILVRYGMADLSSLLYLPCTGLKTVFFHFRFCSPLDLWQTIGCELGGCLSLLQTSLIVLLFFLWACPCSVYGMLLHMNCILTQKLQRLHFSGLSQCWWCFFWVRLEFHTIDAYSITLLTSFVYTLIRTVLLPPICLSLFNIYNILYALFVMFNMFCCHLRSLVITTPRSFISLTTSNTTPSMFNSGLKSFLFDVLKSMTLNFYDLFSSGLFLHTVQAQRVVLVVGSLGMAFPRFYHFPQKAHSWVSWTQQW